jgi:hypothetical protein
MNSPFSAFALICPVCGGQIEKVVERGSRSLFTCKECNCDVIVPTAAWEIARLKREQRWREKRSTLNPLGRIMAPRASLAAGNGTREK